MRCERYRGSIDRKCNDDSCQRQAQQGNHDCKHSRHGSSGVQIPISYCRRRNEGPVEALDSRPSFLLARDLTN